MQRNCRFEIISVCREENFLPCSTEWDKSVYFTPSNLLPKSVVKMKHYKRFDIGNLLQRLFCGTDLRLYLSYGDNGARGGADIGGDKKSCP